MQLNDCPESAEDFTINIDEDTMKPLDVVCFGILSSMRVAIVEEYPKADTGADILSLNEFIAADAPITSLTLDGLGCRVGLISNDIGNDPDGKMLLGRFEGTDVVTTITLLGDVGTPFGLTVVDRESNRTWFVFLSDAIQSLLTVDLSLIHQTNLLYVDVYPEIWQASLRAIDCAIELGVPIFVNLGKYVPDEELGSRLQRGVSVIQKGVVGQSTDQAREITQILFDNYSASLCVITMARDGVVYTNHSGTYYLPAHDVEVVNTTGAGATFSAGLIFGRVQSWPDDKTVAFANALAGMFCSVPSCISSFSVTDVMEFMTSQSLQLIKL